MREEEVMSQERSLAIRPLRRKDGEVAVQNEHRQAEEEVISYVWEKKKREREDPQYIY